MSDKDGGASRSDLPLVSVVMPAYNRAFLIEESIRSVLTQRMGDLELLVADDGSTDETPEIVQRLAKEDPRIRFIPSARNSGDPAVPRNAALRSARGKYVAFLDSDDLWLPEKLAVQLPFLEANPRFGAVHANAVAFRSDGSGKERAMHDFPPHRDGYIFDRMVRGDAIITATFTLRRSCLDSTGFFREGIPVGEDYEFKLRVARDYEVAYQDRVLARYRIHDSNISSDEIRNRRNDYRIIEESAATLGIPDQLRRRSLSTILYHIARAKFLKGDEFKEEISKSQSLDPWNFRMFVLRCLSSFPTVVFKTVERLALLLRGIYCRFKFCKSADR